MSTLMRTRSRLSSASKAPPPSPIPTGKGSRSATGQILSEYIDKSVEIPELTLPEYVHRSVPADVDYQSLVSRDDDSVKRLLRSAAEFGVFRISGHEISAEELQSTLEEADWVFRITAGGQTECCRHYDGRVEFVWRRSDKAMAAKRALELLGGEKYRSFSQNMENVAGKLEAIAEELAKVISERASSQFQTRIQPRESILSLCRYNHHTRINQNPPSSNEKNPESCDYALTLYLLVEEREFCVQSERGPLSFDTRPDTIVVTVGKQLEDWSQGRFKSASGELIFGPNLDENRTSFSMELKCSPTTFNHSLGKTNKKISIADQFLILLVMVFLYKIFVFISF